MSKLLIFCVLLATAAAPARDGDIAVREEYAAAVEAGTPEALRLFVARHPDHPLSIRARARLKAMDAPDQRTTP